MARYLRYFPAWLKYIANIGKVKCQGLSTVKFKSLRVPGKNDQPVLRVGWFRHSPFNLNCDESEICSQIICSSFCCFTPRNCVRYASNSANRYSRQRIPREALVLLLVGVTGGVVYGLNKKYEHDRFDREIDEINKIIKEAQTLDNDRRQKGVANELYKKALEKVKIQIDSEQSQQRMSALTTKFVFIIDQLANLMHGLGKLDEAEDYYKQTLKALLSHGTKQDDDSVIEISLKLASIYAEKNRYELAENGFTWCVENARKKVNTGRLDANTNSAALLGICLESYGKYCLSRKHASKAISLFSEALVISRNVFEEKHPQVVLLLNNLGVAYFETGDMETSKTFFNEAISLSTQGKHEDLWSFHLNLANVLAQTGEIEDARKEYKQSLQLCHSETSRDDIKEQLLNLP